jgi:lipopolysaccharide transport system ATP-binding protein
MTTAIQVEGLAKSYQIPHDDAAPRYTTLRDDLAAKFSHLLRRKSAPGRASSRKEEFWALRDIGFEVKTGERLGIVGHNGAGKSTLLKLLSRVTEPTLGRIALRGHVASLLEVGTGFHPELTGRENIFLNAAILGMSTAKIRQNFDAIVAFSDVERFLDTPVKRYSSGMYLRLAFAVAAHLEPEILIIDEVLAVGDAQFQRKCLGKMDDIGKSGRTILFVSHNLRAIRNLCPRSILLEKGRLLADGDTESVLQQYAESSGVSGASRAWAEETTRSPAPDFTLHSATLRNEAGQPHREFGFLAPISIEVCYSVRVSKPYRVKVAIISADDIQIFFTGEYEAADDIPVKAPGSYVSTCTIPGHLLNEGRYSVDIHVDVAFEKVFADEKRVLDFVVVATEELIRLRDRPYGLICPRVDWRTTVDSDERGVETRC